MSEDKKKKKPDYMININFTEERIIRDHVIWSLAGGLVPIPMLDFAAVTAVQIDLVKDLCQIYDINFSKMQAKAWISGLVGSTFAKLGASALKIIPGIGSFLGGASMSILSGASTYALGKALVHHFDKGGTLENFNIKELREFYKCKLEEGKDFVKEHKEEFEIKEKKEKKTTKENKETKK